MFVRACVHVCVRACVYRVDNLLKQQTVDREGTEDTVSRVSMLLDQQTETFDQKIDQMTDRSDEMMTSCQSLHSSPQTICM